MITKHQLINYCKVQESKFHCKANRTTNEWIAKQFELWAQHYAYWRETIASMNTVKYYWTVARQGVSFNF